MRALILAAVVLFGLPCSGARAQSCNFTIADIDFGTVDILAGGAVTVPASLQITCSGLSLNTVRVCASIGAGSGGAVAGARHLAGPPGSTLNYQLFQGGGAVWGSNYWGLPGTPPTIDVPLNFFGNGSATVPISAQLFGAQATARVGSYVSNFTTSDNIFDYGYTFIGIVGCNLIPLLPQVGGTTFAVRAEIEDNCLVSALDIDFGTHGLLTSNVDANGEVSITCTNGTPYTVGLDGGQAVAPPAARQMKDGVKIVTYGIYQDGGYTQPWGDTLGTTQAGTGSGLAQPLTTHGRVPPQAAAPGSYTDSIVVTVTY